MKRKYIIVLVIIFFILLIVRIFTTNNKHSSSINNPNVIRYVAIGDSYTIGDGVTEDQRWPNLLANHLQESGIPVSMVANPSVTGWTSEQALEQELPLYDQSNPEFATLMIGVNDWVQGVSPSDFRANMSQLLDKMQAKLAQKNHLLVITIPDFSATPTGKAFADGRDISAGVAQFNVIIKEEAKKRGLSVVDIYPLTQQMAGHPELINPDGLHPSPKEYVLWEQLLFPVAKKLLKNK